MKDRVTEYADAVASGRITENIGRLHRLSCERHMRDLARQDTDEFPYIWVPERGAEIINYFEALTLAEGMEPKPVKLLDCQAFDIGSPFGWIHRDTGFRRFRRKYKSEARQNGKTFENGGTGTYVAGFSGYRYGKLFTVATKKRQARLAWEEMAKFIAAEPELEYDKYENPDGYFKVMDYKSTIEAVNTHCTIEALSRESGLDDGFRAIYASIDELHAHKDNRVYKAIYNGTRALPETLVSMITTRGEELNSFCKEMDDYAISILEGNATAEDFFVDIYALDEGDDIWDEANWGKANPFVVTNPQMLETLRRDAQTARDMGGSDLRDFMTKCLNLWVQKTNDQFIAPDDWKKCAIDGTLEDMRGQRCFVGLDLSSGGDLTTLALEFPLEDDSYRVYSHSFMPRGRLEEHIASDLCPYDLFESQGLITVTGGETDYKNDYKFIIKHLKDLQAEFGFKFCGIGIDPHNADGVLADLEDLGCPVLTVTQSARNLTDATDDIRLVVKSGKFQHEARDELLTWSVMNARLTRDSFDNIKIDKKPGKAHSRIDPVDAMVDAHYCMMKSRDEHLVDTNAAMTDYLSLMGWG